MLQYKNPQPKGFGGGATGDGSPDENRRARLEPWRLQRSVAGSSRYDRCDGPTRRRWTGSSVTARPHGSYRRGSVRRPDDSSSRGCSASRRKSPAPRSRSCPWVPRRPSVRYGSSIGFRRRERPKSDTGSAESTGAEGSAPRPSGYSAGTASALVHSTGSRRSWSLGTVALEGYWRRSVSEQRAAADKPPGSATGGWTNGGSGYSGASWSIRRPLRPARPLEHAQGKVGDPPTGHPRVLEEEREERVLRMVRVVGEQVRVEGV